MKHTSDISDEQLARYLSGTATPDEESEVLDHAAAADEHAEELLDIAAAIRVQQKAQQKQRSARPIYLAAAVLVLLIAAGAGYLFLGNSPDMGGTAASPATAEIKTTDSAEGIPASPATPSQQVKQQEEVRQQQAQQTPTYRMERQEHVTAARQAARYADSVTPSSPDTSKTCLKSITL